MKWTMIHTRAFSDRLLYGMNSCRSAGELADEGGPVCRAFIIAQRRCAQIRPLRAVIRRAISNA